MQFKVVKLIKEGRGWGFLKHPTPGPWKETPPQLYLDASP